MGGVLIIAAMVCAFIIGRDERSGILCRSIEVNVLDSMENRFITAAQVKKIIDKEYGKYTGIAIDSIDLLKIEEIIDSRTAVLKSQVYVTKDSTLHVDVTQRKPIVRFQQGKKGYYADKEGFIFPLQNTFASHVQVVDGAIPVTVQKNHKGEVPDPKEREWLLNTVKLVRTLEEKDGWKDIVVQMHVVKGGEIILITREGNEKFIFGHPEDIEHKFGKMRIYYERILAEKGEEEYNSVDLRYNRQIICKNTDKKKKK
jgi:cell division protein FtsQ